MKSYYFLQRSKPNTKTRHPRALAWAILFAAVLFAVIMHLPKPTYHSVATTSRPRTTPAINIPVVKTITEEQQMPYGTTTVVDPTVPAGTSQVRTPGIVGIWTKTYQTTTTNGKESPRRLVNITTTRQPVSEVIVRGSGS